MPLFKYSCKCGARFERLSTASQRDSQKCPCCSEPATRDVTQGFAVKSPISPSDKVIQTGKEIDLVVGRDSEQRWGSYEQRRKDRREGMVEIASDVSLEGRVNPGSVLGGKDRQAVESAHSAAVKRGDPSVRSSWLDKLDPNNKASGLRRLDPK